MPFLQRRDPRWRRYLQTLPQQLVKTSFFTMKNIALSTLLLSAGIASAQGFDNFSLCKAAISTEMGREAKIMKSLKSDPSLPEISYTRNDGKNYRYNCKIEGNRITWRTYFNDYSKTGWGRWRNENGDSVITYEVKEQTLFIKNSSTGEIYKFNKQNF